jgi:hypothetical protein
MLRKVCKVLLESILNHHILTIKHLRITVDREYAYGLPRFLGIAVGYGTQPIKYRMLKSMDFFILSARANLLDSYNQNHISKVSFKLISALKMDLNYDQASSLSCFKRGNIYHRSN